MKIHVHSILSLATRVDVMGLKLSYMVGRWVKNHQKLSDIIYEQSLTPVDSGTLVKKGSAYNFNGPHHYQNAYSNFSFHIIEEFLKKLSNESDKLKQSGL